MSFNAGSITSALGLDVSPFGQGMLQAQGIMNVFPDLVTNFLANPLLGVIGILSDVAGAMVNAFQSATANADKLNDMATATGVNVTQLSALGLVAGQAGSGLESMGDAFKFLGKNAAEAADGNKEAIAAFGDLGISQEQVTAGMNDLPGLLLKVSDAMVNMSGPERTATAMKLLGRSGTELIPTLAQGSAAIRKQMAQFEAYGATVSENAAASADAWGDTIGEIGIAWSGLQNAFAEPLRDALLPMLLELLEWVRTHSAEIKAYVKAVADAVVAAAKIVMTVLQPIVTVLGSMVSLVGGLAGNVGEVTSAVSNTATESLTIQETFAKRGGVSIGTIQINGIDPAAAASEVATQIAPIVHRAVSDEVRAWRANAGAVGDKGAL